MTGPSLRVLAYHRVTEPDGSDGSARPTPSLVSATPGDFERQVEHLVKRYHVVSLAAVLEAQRGGEPLPPRAVLVTFDDAYHDFADTAWPILRRHGLSATLFVPTGYPDHPERAFWWDRLHHALAHTSRRVIAVPGLGTLRLDSAPARSRSLLALQRRMKALPHDRALALVETLCRELEVAPVRGSAVSGWDELRRLAAEGVFLGAHTRTHPALTRLPMAAVRAEVRGSLDDIGREIGSVYPVFCAPFGLFDDGVVRELERQGVELAFTCLDGHNAIPSADPLRLRRTVITRRTSPAIFRLRLRRAVSYIDMWRHRARPNHAGPARNGGTPAPTAVGEAPLRVAYIMSRFPKLSETFVLNEILAMESLGVGVEVFPLLRERQPVSHPEAIRLAARAHFHPFLSVPILRAVLHFLRRQPRASFRVAFEVLRGTFGSANFFVGALGIGPKAVRFAYEMRRLGVSHVHAHFCTHPAIAALIVHRLTGIPFSFTAHGSDLHVERRMLPAKVDAAAFAATVCGFNREVMVRECGEGAREKIHVIRCGVDPEVFAPPAARPDRDAMGIICVASLEEVKGHRYLLDACRLLKERGVAFQCHLVGDGPLRQALQDHIRQHGLEHHVLLHGGQPRAAVARMLADAEVAVLASHPTRDGKREGLPVALMEAMAAGLPVVASDLSGIPELVAHGTTGLLVPPGDAPALADALERLSRDTTLRRSMSRAARARILAEYTLLDNARALLTLIRAAAAAPAPESTPRPAPGSAAESAMVAAAPAPVGGGAGSGEGAARPAAARAEP